MFKNTISAASGGAKYFILLNLLWLILLYPCYFILDLHWIWTALILLVCFFFKAAAIPFWIWGFVVAVNSEQDVFTVIFYILMVLNLIPLTIQLVSFLRKLILKLIMKSSGNR